MKNLPDSLLNKAKKYINLNDYYKRDLLDALYNKYELSWGQIAVLCKTYSNKVRRDANSLGLRSRTKAEAQALALKEGRHDHPTKGKNRSKEVKIKISESVSADWDNMSEEERQIKREEAKKRWNLKSDEEIRQFFEASVKAVKKAATEGSALEKFLFRGLLENGYRVEFHKERWVVREKLQIDLFISDLNVAIEVDGPSHFKDIWGESVLHKNQLRDREKNGLLLQQGYIIVRIKQTRSLSEKYKRDTLKELVKILEKISKKRPEKGNRCITIGSDI